MLSAELKKDLKRTPVVEYMIPKKLFPDRDGEHFDSSNILLRLWDFD